MIHLLPSIGYPSHQGYEKTLEYALRDLKSLVDGGVDAVLVENDNDQPHQVEVGPEGVSFMTSVVSEIVKASSFPVGVEVLLNDPKASLPIAQVTGCDFLWSFEKCIFCLWINEDRVALF